MHSTRDAPDSPGLPYAQTTRVTGYCIWQNPDKKYSWSSVYSAYGQDSVNRIKL